jgi:protein O-GlcNAc transferase
MGLRDRFQAIWRAPVSGAEIKPEAPEQKAIHLIEEGNAFEDEGKNDEAIRRYEEAILLAPGLARAHLNRGNILLAIERTEEALGAFGTALSLDPDYAAAHYNVGNAYARMGQHEAALNAYREAIQLKPDFADAEVALGCAQEDLGLLEDAAASYGRALEIQPDYADVHGNLGKVLTNLGRLDDATASFRRAQEIRPDSAETHFNLGMALRANGQRESALASLNRALEINPEHAAAHGEVGAILLELGQFAASIESSRKALAINPGFVLVHNNLGCAFKELGQFDAAAEHYNQALEISPDSVMLHSNLGITQFEAERFEAAVTSLRRALEIDPDCVIAHTNLGVALKELGQHNAAVASCRRALEIKPDFVEALDILLFIHNCLADQPVEVMLADAKHYGVMVAQRARAHTTWLNSAEPNRPLRVGMVSGDLRNHPVAFFLENVLAALKTQSSERLSIVAYSNHPGFDQVSQRIKANCAGWHQVAGLSDEHLAQRIREDEIDILIDLSGHTAHNRLPMFAWKPAPVQAAWLGYFATTGVTAIDYLIADPWTLPDSEESNFTEAIWRLPETRLCFTAPQENVDIAPLPALQNGYITFGCFNNLTKMNDDVVALWAQILNAMPGSRLFLKCKQLQEAQIRQSVVERFSAHGVDGNRLLMENPDIRANYLSAYNRVDIALDPFPYTGGTTSVEGLWMGVPVLTLAGERFLSRQGIGLLMNSGLPEWIASDPSDYVRRAISLASDLQSLAALRSSLRQLVLASPIFDAPRFARHFEDTLRGMWRKWCEHQQATGST